MGENVAEAAPATEPTAKPSRFARFHAQTYEMELLVSGALTFALLQAPAYLDHQFERVLTYVDGDLRLLTTYGVVYISLAVTALIACFASNLLMRAFWIGMVGLESVFPEGTDWDRLKIGPHFKRSLREKMPTLSASIERLDNACSLVFSLAFTIVLSFVYSVGLILACLPLAWIVARLGSWRLDDCFWIFCGAALGLATLVPLVDRFLGPRLTPGGRLDRLLAAIVWMSLGVSPLRLVGSISLVLQSRLTEKRSNALILGSMMAIVGVSMVSLFVRHDLVGVGSLVYQPRDPGTEGVEAKSYRSNWNADDFDEASWRPSIDTEVSVEPYVRLFLPYRPAVHNGRIAAACPDLVPLREEGMTFGGNAEPGPQDVARRSVDCLVGLFTLQLDGEPLTELRFDWFTEPLLRVPGAIAYLDVRNLPAGRHELQIEAPTGRFSDSPEGQEPHRQMVIPFWR